MNYLYTDMFISFYEPVKLSLNVPIHHSHNLEKLNLIFKYFLAND